MRVMTHLDQKKGKIEYNFNINSLLHKRLLFPTFYCALVGLLFTCVVYYPGILNNDSTWQLQQARSGIYHDLHPPIMSVVWRILDRVISGPGGPFLFHSFLCWYGLAVILFLLFDTVLLSTVFTWILGSYLPIFAALGMVSKDVGFMGALLVTVGLGWHSEKNHSKYAICFGMLTLFYAQALRHNAFAATLPISIWFGRILLRYHFPQLRPHPMKEISAGIVLFIVFTLLVFWTNRKLTVHTDYPSQQLFVFDLVGISVRAKHNYLPSFYNRDLPPFTVSELQDVYTPGSVNWILWWACDDRRCPGFVNSRDEYNILASTWLKTALKEPRAYLSHRWDVFAGILGIPERNLAVYWLGEEDGAITRSKIPLNKGVIVRWINRLENSILFRPYLYFFIILAAMGVACFTRKLPTVFWVLGFSAILYEGLYFWVGQSSEFRYSWWLLFVACLLPLMLLKQWTSHQFLVKNSKS